MLIIRPEQIKKFEDKEVTAFEDRVASHIQETFPEKFAEIQGENPGSDKVKEFIRDGIEKASSYDITSEREVQSFIDLMIKVEKHFDKRNDMVWAKEILEDDLLNQKLKMELIKYQLPSDFSKAD